MDKIAVVILNWNGCEMLRSFLPSVVRYSKTEGAKIYVADNGEVELVPRVGEHTVLLGTPTRVEEKLARLKEFYTEGLNKVGWNKYSALNLKYDNQVICKKK